MSSRSDGQARAAPGLPEAGRPLARPVPAATIGLLLAATAVALYWPASRFDFINLDDAAYFSGNSRVLGGLKWDNARWAFSTTYLGNWHPLTWLSLMLDVTLFGPGPRGPHLVNALLHAVNGALAFLLLRRMTGAPWRSAAVAALFALHPLRVESVAWVAERKDVLSGLFFFLTLWAYGRYAETQNPKFEFGSGKSQSGAETKQRQAHRAPGITLRASSPPTCPLPCPPPHRTFWYWAALIPFTLGLMSKPMLVTVPFVLLLLDYWPLQRLRLTGPNSRRPALAGLVREKAAFFLLAGLFCVATIQAQSHAGAMITSADLPLTARMENALVSYARYLGKTLWPINLALPYPYPPSWPWGAVAVATALLLGLCVATLWRGRRQPYLVTGWFWWLGMLFPVIGLTQAGGQAMADRFTYLPAIGLLTALVWAVAEWAAHKRALRALAGAGLAAALAGCWLRTADQLRHWRESETLFRHAIAHAPDNCVAHNSLGAALAAKGRWEAAIYHYEVALRISPGFAAAHLNLAAALLAQAKWEEAIRQCELALAIRPDLAEAQNNLGLALAGQKRWGEAIQHYQRALEAEPDFVAAEVNLANALCGQGRWFEAIPHYERALQIQPALAEADNNLGQALAALGKWQEALPHYEAALRAKPALAEARNNFAAGLLALGRTKEAVEHYELALKLDPNLADAHSNLGLALARSGRWIEAEAHYEKALALRPQAVSARNNLAWLLATCPEGSVRNGARAVELGRELLRLAGENDRDSLDTLAAAYAEAGRFPEAIEAAGRALALAVAQHYPQAEEIRARFRLYQSGAPYREPAPDK